MRDAAGLPLPEATVLVTNTASVERWRTATDAGGRFRFERLSVGSVRAEAQPAFSSTGATGRG